MAQYNATWELDPCVFVFRELMKWHYRPSQAFVFDCVGFLDNAFVQAPAVYGDSRKSFPFYIEYISILAGNHRLLLEGDRDYHLAKLNLKLDNKVTMKERI